MHDVQLDFRSEGMEIAAISSCSTLWSDLYHRAELQSTPKRRRLEESTARCGGKPDANYSSNQFGLTKPAAVRVVRQKSEAADFTEYLFP